MIWQRPEIRIALRRLSFIWTFSPSSEFWYCAKWRNMPIAGFLNIMFSGDQSNAWLNKGSNTWEFRNVFTTQQSRLAKALFLNNQNLPSFWQTILVVIKCEVRLHWHFSWAGDELSHTNTELVVQYLCGSSYSLFSHIIIRYALHILMVATENEAKLSTVVSSGTNTELVVSYLRGSSF